MCEPIFGSKQFNDSRNLQEAEPVKNKQEYIEAVEPSAAAPRRVLGQFRRNTQGATAIEFGLVALPFMTLLIAIFETALIFFTQSALDSGVANAGRMVRTGQVQAQGLSEDQFKTMVCNSMAGYLDCNNRLTVDVRSFSTFAAVTLPAALDADGELAPGTQFTPGASSEVVVVRAFYTWDLLMPGELTGLGNMAGSKRLLAAASAFRNEPF